MISLVIYSIYNYLYIDTMILKLKILHVINRYL